jgi:hypothetical protein
MSNKSIYTRVRAAQARLDKERAAAEYKAGEYARRVRAGHLAAETRRERRIDDLLEGRAKPRTAADFRILDRAEGLYEDLLDEAVRQGDPFAHPSRRQA